MQARRRGIAIGLSALVLLAGVAAGQTTGAGASESAQAGIPRPIRATLLRDARHEAAVDGDRHPHDIEAVATTTGAALRMTCEPGCTSAPGNTPVYVVAMRGHFRCNRCSHPHGRTFGSGRVITLVFDARTLARTELAFGDRYPNLNSAGIPVRLDTPPQHHGHR